MYLIMLVLDDPGKLDGVLESWERLGIRGATIVESTGIRRLKKKQVAMRYVFSAPGFTEQGHLTLFVIVETKKMVKDCLRTTQEVVTDLDGPNTGVFAAWPLAVVRGVPARDPNR
jgi:nitrogen regulatory protein P-II 1